MKRVISLLILTLLWSCSSNSEKTDRQTENPKDKQPEKISEASSSDSFLGNLRLTTLAGEPIQNSIYKDKILILNLWATWCKPCIKEMPDLKEMISKLSDDFVLILASDEELTKVQKFIERRPMDLDFISIQNSIESLGVYALPSTFIIAKDGQLLETLVGARDWKSQETIDHLNKITQ